MARRPLPHLRTLAATRKFVSENAGLQGLKLHIAAADGLASAAEMHELLEEHGSRGSGDWEMGNRRLLRAAAALYEASTDARQHLRALSLAVRDRFAVAIREPHHLLPGVLDDTEAAELKGIRDRLLNTACRPAREGATNAGNRLNKVTKALKSFDVWFEKARRDRLEVRELKKGCRKVLRKIKGLRSVIRGLVREGLRFPA